MCRCMKSAFKEDFPDKTEKKSPFRAENEGLRRWKSYLDEKYKIEDAFLSDNQTKVSKNTGKHP